MAKAPIAGRAKTRLAREVGIAEATRFARESGAALLQRVARDSRWRTTLAVAPPHAGARPFWPKGVAWFAQQGADLGHRLQHIFDRAVRGPVVIIGTDIPAIRPAHIMTAFRLLGRHDAVFGPASDGGYWLVGLRRRPRVLRAFSGVRWSSPEALRDTLANLAGQSVAFAATLSDVDSGGDMLACRAYFGRRVLPHEI